METKCRNLDRQTHPKCDIIAYFIMTYIVSRDSENWYNHGVE